MTDTETTLPKSELSLVEARLSRSSFELLGQVKAGPISLKEAKLKSRVKVNKGTKEILVYLDFDTIAHEDGVGDLFKLSTSYFGSFRATPNTTEEQLIKFAKLNAPSILFPSLRACIAMLTVAGGVPPLTLPVVNFQKIDTPIDFLE